MCTEKLDARLTEKINNNSDLSNKQSDKIN